MQRGFFFRDNDHRALLRVSAKGPKKSLNLTLEIDTGADAVFLSKNLADDLGVTLIDKGEFGTLADGISEVALLNGQLEIKWIDGTKNVDIKVWRTGPPVKSGKNKIDGLIGRNVFADSHLAIDYVNRKVAITTPAQ